MIYKSEANIKIPKSIGNDILFRRERNEPPNTETANNIFGKYITKLAAKYRITIVFISYNEPTIKAPICKKALNIVNHNNTEVLP